MLVYLDADACPVKDEAYRVVRRHGIKVLVVANSVLRVPPDDLIEFILVKGGFDAADDWIAERIAPGDIAITSDIPLAARCLQRGARVLRPNGVEFTEDTIGNAALATRLTCLDMLRQTGDWYNSARTSPLCQRLTDRVFWQSSTRRFIRSVAISADETTTSDNRRFLIATRAL